MAHLVANGDVGFERRLRHDEDLRLRALGLFRRVRIVDIPHQASPNRDVLVEVEEAPSTTLDYGGGVEAGRRVGLADASGRAEERIEVAPRGFFQISRRNLWGKNRSISLFTRVSLRTRDPAVDSTDPEDLGGYGFNEYRVVGTFREPRLIDAPGELLLTAFLEQGIRSSFNFSRRGVRAEYARRVGPVVTVSGRYAIDRTRLFDEKIQPEDQLLIDRLFPQVRLSTLTGFFPRIRKAYLVGEAAAEFAAELEGKVPHIVAGTIERAVSLAARDAEAAGAGEPVVLLSPACASFDQFRNFEVRGDAFRELVLALPGVQRAR